MTYRTLKCAIPHMARVYYEIIFSKRDFNYTLLAAGGVSSQHASNSNNERNCAAEMGKASPDHFRALQR